MRVVDAVLVGCVYGEEFVYPRFEQLAGFDGMVLRKALEALRAEQGVRDLAILVHARRAVGVELAKADTVIVLVEEHVDAGEREQCIVAAREQDELFETRVE